MEGGRVGNKWGIGRGNNCNQRGRAKGEQEKRRDIQMDGIGHT